VNKKFFIQQKVLIFAALRNFFKIQFLKIFFRKYNS